MIKLFEIENNVVKVTEHCHVIAPFKAIIKEYPDPDIHINIFAYIFYMSCPSQENPFFNVPEEDKEDFIEDEIEINFSTECDLVQAGLEHAEKLYETPTVRAYLGMKKMIDNLSKYMGETKIEHGRDGNISALVQAAKNFAGIRESFKSVSADLSAEQETHVRGDKTLGYDQI
jgi:hypothetical protein